MAWFVITIVLQISLTALFDLARVFHVHLKMVPGSQENAMGHITDQQEDVNQKSRLPLQVTSQLKTSTYKRQELRFLYYFSTFSASQTNCNCLIDSCPYNSEIL